MEQAKVDLRGKIPDTGHRLRSLLCTSFVEQRSISFERRAQPACPPQLQELGDRRIVHDGLVLNIAIRGDALDGGLQVEVDCRQFHGQLAGGQLGHRRELYFNGHRLLVSLLRMKTQGLARLSSRLQ